MESVIPIHCVRNNALLCWLWQSRDARKRRQCASQCKTDEIIFKLRKAQQHDSAGRYMMTPLCSGVGIALGSMHQCFDSMHATTRKVSCTFEFPWMCHRVAGTGNVEAESRIEFHRTRPKYTKRASHAPSNPILGTPSSTIHSITCFYTSKHDEETSITGRRSERAMCWRLAPHAPCHDASSNAARTRSDERNQALQVFCLRTAPSRHTHVAAVHSRSGQFAGVEGSPSSAEKRGHKCPHSARGQMDASCFSGCIVLQDILHW
jgi:hypothetical protein